MPIFYQKWHKERKKIGIKLRMLYKAYVKSKIKKEYYDVRRFLPPQIVNPAVINIYGDRVVNIIWKGDYPLCFVMVNKDIADAYRKYFELLWRGSDKE